MSAKKIPEGFATVTPTLVLKGAARAIEFYKKALGAKEVYRMESPDKQSIMHACLEIGNSKVFLCDTNPQMCPNPTSGSFYLYVEDADAAFKQAVNAGCKELSPVKDMFWGDRTGLVEDSFGLRWNFATHVRDVSDAELAEGAKKMASSSKAA